MVIFRRPEGGKPGYHQAESVDDAIRFVEMLRNQEQVNDARIFRMEEVPIEIRTYYRVELAGAGGAPGESPSASPAQAAGTPTAAAPTPPEPANADAAELAPQEVLRPVPVAVANAGKGRRFNRS